MLRKLSNNGEAFIHELLFQSAARHGAEIYRKARIADAIDVDQLGSRDLARFALMGHFDFVITQDDRSPPFAVEFDGTGHDDRRDHLKDEICRRANLALFRLDPSSSRVKIKQASFVAYLLDVWFFSKQFVRMHANGELPPDEPFMMSGFLKPNAKNIFDSEFVFTFDAMARLNKLLGTGNLFEHLNASSLSMVGPNGEYVAFARHLPPHSPCRGTRTARRRETPGGFKTAKKAGRQWANAQKRNCAKSPSTAPSPMRAKLRATVACPTSCNTRLAPTAKPREYRGRNRLLAKVALR